MPSNEKRLQGLQIAVICGMKISYISAGLAAVTAVLCCKYYFAMAETARIRVEGVEFQQLTESLQPQMLEKRQRLQAQQEKLNKGSAISQSIGPAVLADIRAASEKSNNVKLKELLVKYGVREVGGGGGTGSQSEAGAQGAQGAAKKGGN